MRLHRAEIMRLETADGLTGMGQRVQVGDVYYLDLDQVREMQWGEAGRTGWITRRSIWSDASPNGGHEGWMPVELFDLPEELLEVRGVVGL